MSNLRGAAIAAMITAGLLASAAFTAPASGVVPPTTTQPATGGPAMLRPMPSISQAAMIGPEDCVPFDPSTVKAMGGGGMAMVVAGSMPLLKYWPDKASADRAVNVIHSYGFNEQCFAGRLPGALMYFKAAGHIPANPLAGEDCINVNSAGVSVFNSSGTWIVLAGLTPVAKYGTYEQAAAARAVELIKAYKFTRQCAINRPNAVMTYWLK
jgi:hypothetical protein